MATLLELIADGRLVKLDPQLGKHELEERQIFLLPQTAIAVTKLLETMESEWDIESTPAEQLDELVYHFVTGGQLDYPRQFHVLDHARDGVWQLKTQDLRLFGWFPTKDCFICSDITNANEIKRLHQYSGYCEQTWFRREKLDLDEPKYIDGMEPKDVVSNCNPT